MISPLLLRAWQRVCAVLFGTFETEELKKFSRMGVIFAGIIGSYWTLRVLKDSIFDSLVGLDWQFTAKLVSPIALVPVVLAYTVLLEKYSRAEVFYLLARVYSALTLFFGIATLWMQGSAAEVAARTGFFLYATKVYGFVWYVFVESYGSLIVALFWAIASDITAPDSAKRGFAYVTMLGQMGGIFMPMVINSLPKKLQLATSGLSVIVCALTTLSLIYLMRNFFKKTPSSLLVSFHGKNEKAAEREQEPGFFEGLRLMLQHKYLMGIFAVLFVFEFLVTVFDYNFKVLARASYSGVDLAEYLSYYGSSVNFVALLCLLFGVSNIVRYLGVTVALVLMPILFGAAVTGFTFFPSNLAFLFALMVGAKAINYALNGPALKQLYIPTTHDVRFKSQAWIETFGSRGSKAGGSALNSMAKVLGNAQYLMLAAYLGFGLVAVWFVVALFLGRTYNKAIDSKTVVC